MDPKIRTQEIRRIYEVCSESTLCDAKYTECTERGES